MTTGNEKLKRGDRVAGGRFSTMPDTALKDAQPAPCRIPVLITRPEASVFVVDGDPSVRRSTRHLIRSEGLAVRTFSSFREFLKLALPEGPACLVLEVELPEFSGMDLQLTLEHSEIHLPVIFISAHADVPMVVRAIKAGAVDFLIKPVPDNSLLYAIRAAIAHDRAACMERSATAELQARYDTLSHRERQVMGMVVEGLLNKQIAAELGTCEITVKVQRSHMMQKMKATSVADLVRMVERLHPHPWPACEGDGIFGG